MHTKDLLYRRQFFLGNSFLEKFNNWSRFEIDEKLFLYAHPELNVNQYTVENNTITVTLIGFIIDPYEPLKNNCEVLADLAENISSFRELQEKTYHLSGRWAIIYRSETETMIIHDPCGMRQVFFTEINNQIYCGSQPTILQEVLNLQVDKDPDLIEFLESDQYEMSERAWVGDGTAYKNVKHLLPNHYLDIRKNETKRFWINKEESTHINLENTVEEVAELLKDSITGLRHRHKAMLAVTAGWDSRVLLAASKDIKDTLKYYVSTHNILKHDHMDIEIPLKLSEKLNLNLEVVDNLPELNPEFFQILEHNVSHARALPKTLTIQYFLNNIDSDYVNINGNGSEIARSFFGDINSEIIDAQYISNLLGYQSYNYVENALDNWLKSASLFSKNTNIELMDLFYWEQRMGNWGTMYQAELDIAIEEFSPFNNRKILMLLMSIDKKYREEPDFIIYNKIIKYLWEETLSEPINPLSFTGKIKNSIVGLLPESMKTRIKKIIR